LGLAYESGFNSKTVFNAFFKKIEGMTPRAWVNLRKNRLMMNGETSPKFTRYQYFILAIITLVFLTIVLDFMLMSALSAILLPKLEITTKQFGLLVSAYPISAGISAILLSGYADKFDRKKLLLFFYSGFC
jgi:sugar phosphate permease